MHSDVKPANLLISEDDRLCLCDFGISDKTDFPRILSHSLDLFRAVHHIHSNEHGMIHSDIKPANLLISEDDRLCLCDFGISDKTDFPRILSHSLDLFRAVHHIHSNEHGMIHSDIKPANLLISEDDRLCLCDFGIWDKTGAKFRGGTPSYLAPEALCQDAVLTRKIDIYACGITLAEMAHQPDSFKELA